MRSPHVCTHENQPPPFTTNATECQIMNLGFIAIVPPERIAAPHRTIEKVELSIPDKTTMSARRETSRVARDRIAAESITPSSSALQELAKKSPPPQEWWDEDFEGL